MPSRGKNFLLEDKFFKITQSNQKKKRIKNTQKPYKTYRPKSSKQIIELGV